MEQDETVVRAAVPMTAAYRIMPALCLQPRLFPRRCTAKSSVYSMSHDDYVHGVVLLACCRLRTARQKNHVECPARFCTPLACPHAHLPGECMRIAGCRSEQGLNSLIHTL